MSSLTSMSSATTMSSVAPIRGPLVASQRALHNALSSGPVMPRPVNLDAPRMHYAAALSSVPVANAAPVFPSVQGTAGTSAIPSSIPAPSQAAVQLMSSIERRTVRLVCPYMEDYIYSREEIFSAIVAQGIAPEHIEGLGRMEKNRIWEVLFSNIAARDKIASLEIIRTANDAAVKVFPITGNIAQIRVYWASFFIPNEAIVQAMEEKTKVNGGKLRILKGETLSIRDKKYNHTSKNGIRSFRAEVDNKDLIPHLLTFKSPERDQPVTVLVTVMGRRPMCLKCKEIGHHRSECTSNQQSDSRQNNAVQQKQVHAESVSSMVRDESSGKETAKTAADVHKAKRDTDKDANDDTVGEDAKMDADEYTVKGDAEMATSEHQEQDDGWQEVPFKKSHQKRNRSKSRDRESAVEKRSKRMDRPLYSTIGHTQQPRRIQTLSESSSSDDEFSTG